MEQILTNTALFINVLGMSRTSAIQQWDIEELKRAFKWADYFQQVYLKLKTRPTQKDLLCKELRYQSCRSGVQLGTNVLQFDDLKDARQILCKNILLNLWCTTEIYTETIKLFYIASESNHASHLLSNDLKEITKMCHISKMLRPIGPELIKASTSMPQSNGIFLYEEDCANIIDSETYTNTEASTSLDFEKDFSKRVQGRLLRNYIVKCLECPESEASLLSHIDDILSSKDDDWHLLAFACNEVDKIGPDLMKFITRLVREKLIPKWRSNPANFMSISASSVLDIAILSEDIFVDYIRLLYDCCHECDQQNSMEELYIISRMRKAPEMVCTRLQNLEKHFEEIHARKEICIQLFRKSEDVFLNPVASSEMTWDQLSKKYLLFVS